MVKNRWGDRTWTYFSVLFESFFFSSNRANFSTTINLALSLSSSVILPFSQIESTIANANWHRNCISFVISASFCKEYILKDCRALKMLSAGKFKLFPLISFEQTLYWTKNFVLCIPLCQFLYQELGGGIYQHLFWHVV